MLSNYKSREIIILIGHAENVPWVVQRRTKTGYLNKLKFCLFRGLFCLLLAISQNVAVRQENHLFCRFRGT